MCMSLKVLSSLTHDKADFGDVSLSTSMHDGLLYALHILHPLGARILEPRLLLYGQGIDISAEQERLTLAILQNSCESMAANVSVDLKSVEGFKVLGDCGRGFLLAE